MTTKPSCPNCGSELVIEISFGFPDPDAEYPKSYYNGGCCIDENTPKYHCTSCENNFGSVFSNQELISYLFSNEYRAYIGLDRILSIKEQEELEKHEKPWVLSTDSEGNALRNGKIDPWSGNE